MLAVLWFRREVVAIRKEETFKGPLVRTVDITKAAGVLFVQKRGGARTTLQVLT